MNEKISIVIKWATTTEWVQLITSRDGTKGESMQLKLYYTDPSSFAKLSEMF